VGLEFPSRPATTLAELQEAVTKLVHQLGDGAKARVMRTLANGEPITVGTTVTAIRHNATKGIPQAASFIPSADCRWWQPQPPDREFVYLQASAAVSGDLVVWL
jgi:hypothetical protein